MAFLLDTNAVIALLEDPRGPVARRARRRRPSEVFLSAIVLHELYFGAFKSERRAKNLERVDSLPLEALGFDLEDARASGEIRAALAKIGTPIGPYDVLIAGQALARGLRLVTSNFGEFSRVHGLRVEDWTQ